MCGHDPHSKLSHCLPLKIINCMTTGVKVYLAYNITTMLTDGTGPNNQGERLNTQQLLHFNLWGTQIYNCILCCFLPVYNYNRAIDKLLKSFSYCIKLFHILNYGMPLRYQYKQVINRHFLTCPSSINLYPLPTSHSFGWNFIREPPWE